MSSAGTSSATGGVRRRPRRKGKLNPVFKDQIMEMARNANQGPEIVDTISAMIDNADVEMMTKALTSLKWEDAVEDLGLKDIEGENSLIHKIPIPKLPELPNCYNVSVPDRLRDYVNLHILIANRKSEAICRTLVDTILTEGIAIIRGIRTGVPDPKNSGSTKTEIIHPDSGIPPQVLDKVQLTGEIAVDYENSDWTTCYTGRIDHGLGLKGAKKQYLSLAAVVEAKQPKSVDAAGYQALTYMGCIHRYRKRQNLDGTVWGMATDGLLWKFFKIADDSTVVKFGDVNMNVVTDLLGVLQTVVAVLHEGLKLLFETSPQTNPSYDGAGDEILRVVEYGHEVDSDSEEYDEYYDQDFGLMD